MEIESATFVAGSTAVSKMPDTGLPEVAFIGRSNVGKSSLLNLLFRRRNLARTSREPGKTREANFYLVNDALYFVDLPGLGYARASRAERDTWRRLIASYLTDRAQLKLVFQLVDGRHEPTETDHEAALLVHESGALHVILVTKADKLSGNERTASTARARAMLDSLRLEVPVVLTSSKTGRGRTEILRLMDSLLQ